MWNSNEPRGIHYWSIGSATIIILNFCLHKNHREVFVTDFGWILNFNFNLEAKKKLKIRNKFFFFFFLLVYWMRSKCISDLNLNSPFEWLLSSALLASKIEIKSEIERERKLNLAIEIYRKIFSCDMYEFRRFET